MKKRVFQLFLAFTLGFHALASAQEMQVPEEPSSRLDLETEPVLDKSAYHLFHPVPAAAMRPLSTDRPDKTESAYTVDAGHFQFEGDLLTLILSQEGEDSSSELLIAPTNLKLGLLNNLDLHLIILPLNWNRLTRTVDAKPTTADIWSFGDMLVRLKYNLWGNDGGDTALSVMPFVKLPTSTYTTIHNLVEGGVVFPFAWDWGAGWGMGAQLQMDLASNQEALSPHPELDARHGDQEQNAPGYHPEFSFAMTIGHDFTDELAAFVELFAGVSSLMPTEPIATFDAGVTYSPFPNTQWDMGFYLGLTSNAPRFNPFLGLSQRF
ncbi:hypothetical protein COW36_24840 [bacterium (Candidatus Blackallbacteria) CG17_big_fil_post_rev_8_21_14_2_50_48_46]|uniref:Transporter n=1 Tax=bacterium (Candidatus Blackallbacteria) CG17_big_fil_post_rev_8_21_14_2_50_48_46 TaxID=2014261 RepID=A0A2M7FYQ1_9BACT|nr:MAG: hypothetical protein COW64_19780 [bacterium (Candidatus Blackallbacteria) CG18_big_fil_WC_8_21_14_2_50_49_26]PIW13896.1 MAG: hypothetical protein COW36_24840 [bacterium (Candidatus Blackallbacteria) CG17_big_fil_post_rev_8_21_14_2_50_48_46]PIW45122.1 MAG: hypothetical protein COW20_22470 [bacterium (Candidatus Blackallbacteria) CG13_big_fil_rev_8_21_14_2_50_49_14]